MQRLLRAKICTKKLMNGFIRVWSVYKGSRETNSNTKVRKKGQLHNTSLYRVFIYNIYLNVHQTVYILFRELSTC